MGSARLRLSNDYQGGWRHGSVLGYAKHEGQMDTLSRGCNSKDLLFFKASDSNSGRTDQHFVQSKAGDFPLYFSALMLPRPELLSPTTSQRLHRDRTVQGLDIITLLKRLLIL